MLLFGIRFASLFLTALLVGAIFGVWWGFDPAPLTASAFVEMQQNAIRAMNVPAPVLGFVCIFLTAALAFFTRTDTRSRNLLIAAAVLLITSGLITRFGNQPINAIVMTWNPTTPPSNWTELRDTWWSFHIMRTLAGMLALALSLLAALWRRPEA